MSTQDTATIQPKRSLLEEFMFGAKNGFYLGVEKIIPAMIIAYVLITFLKITGLMALIGNVISPVMAIFGLPGEAIVALISAFFAKAAGAATAATLYADGTINAVQATILFPATITMGTLIPHFVRCVISSGANPKHHKIIIAVPIIDAVLSMFLTRMIISFMGIS